MQLCISEWCGLHPSLLPASTRRCIKKRSDNWLGELEGEQLFEDWNRLSSVPVRMIVSKCSAIVLRIEEVRSLADASCMKTEVESIRRKQDNLNDWVSNIVERYTFPCVHLSLVGFSDTLCMGVGVRFAFVERQPVLSRLGILDGDPTHPGSCVEDIMRL